MMWIDAVISWLMVNFVAFYVGIAVLLLVIVAVACYIDYRQSKKKPAGRHRA